VRTVGRRSVIPARIRVAGVLLAALLLAGTGAAQPRRSRELSACGVRFQAPAHWRPRSLPTDVDITCAVELRLDRMAQSRDSAMYSVALWTVPGGFAGAVHDAGFRRRRNGWVVLGRMMMESPAHESTRRGLRIVQGTPSIGWFDEHGYAGLAEVSSAVVCRRESCVIIEGGPQSDDAFERILSTVRFPRH
jgi:hypothetical protein